MTFKLNLQFHSIFHIRKTSTTNCVKKTMLWNFLCSESKSTVNYKSHDQKVPNGHKCFRDIFCLKFLFLPVVFCSLLFKLILFFYFPKIELKLHNSYQYIVGHHSHITVILLLKVVAHVAQWLESLELQLKNANYLILW